jgi:hypothetical protein
VAAASVVPEISKIWALGYSSQKAWRTRSRSSAPSYR